MTTTLRPQGPPGTAPGRTAAVPAPRSVSQLYSVCSHGRPIGSVRLSRQDRQGWIADLEVAPERRRRGHGSVAVLAAEEVLRDWGCRRVEVHVPAVAEPALALFEAMGYALNRRRMVKRLRRFGSWPGRRAARLPAGALVRPLREDEYRDWLAEEIAEYAETMAAHTEGGLKEAFARAPEAYAALLPQGLGTPGMAVRVLEMDGTRVGSVLIAYAARDVPGCGWVYHVLVDPRQRGHGYGRVLLLVAERECRAAGVHGLALNVYADNPVALTLYESLGYRTDIRVLDKPL